MKDYRRLFLLFVVLAVAGTGCATMMGTQPGLYERLSVLDPQEKTGKFPKVLTGRDAISVIVDDFVANMLDDPTIKGRFNFKEWPETKAVIAKGLPPALAQLQVVSTFKARLADQICEAAGGPCSYTGRDMKTAHKGMGVTDAEWNATVAALVKALDKNKVPAGEKDELLGLLGPLKTDIVGQ